MNSQMDLTLILQRLEQLEAQNAIRNCIHRYMEICDGLNAKTDLNELMDLFDQDSIWEGIGEKYAQSFGRYASWQAIFDMFKKLYPNRITFFDECAFCQLRTNLYCRRSGQCKLVDVANLDLSQWR